MAFPYYVDSHGLRALADSLGIDLPTVRERTSERRFSLRARGLGGDRTWREGSRLEGHIRLNQLVAELKRTDAYRDIVDALGLIPPVNDRTILRAAIRQIQYMPPEGTADLERRLRTAYESERRREIAHAKRAELKQVAIQNQLVILRGWFEAVTAEGPGGPPRVRLTHLQPAEVVYERLDTPGTELEGETLEIEMPDEVEITAVLPAERAFTDAGRERLNRGAPFYGQVIAHSASFDEAGGVFTCSAYAVWSMPRPAGLMESPLDYDFLEES